MDIQKLMDLLDKEYAENKDLFNELFDTKKKKTNKKQGS